MIQIFGAILVRFGTIGANMYRQMAIRKILQIFE
jgi:hypothetical protein